jgi:pimeloyl-ACP methyl ester carboxylesterase
MHSPRRLLVPALLVMALISVPVAGFAQVRHLEGKTGPGSFYEMDVPTPWNGALVLYAHGIVQADQPVVPPSTQDRYNLFREKLLEQGFAVAASSFSSNGWALADAVQRTHQLGKLFVSNFGQPRQTILVGSSLGGLAVVKLAEKYPSQYSGALAMCAPLGGGIPEVRYAGDGRITFDYYFPDLLPGTPFDVPEGTEFIPPGPGYPGSTLFWQVYFELMNNPAKLVQWVQAAGLPFEAGNNTEMFEQALYFIGFQLRYTNDLIERVNGKIPYGNWTTEYAVAPTPDPATNAYLSALLNAGVTRLLADQAAVNYYERNYEPTGDIRFPVVTMHTTRDAGVPMWHEALFAQKVAEAGNSAWLTQIPVNAVGHCNFQPAEMVDAFRTLLAQMPAVR